MSSRRKLNLNINEIDMVLNSYYKDKVSITMSTVLSLDFDEQDEEVKQKIEELVSSSDDEN